ncbi:MAG: YggS family pyridoxal phosphate-dependent enzyme [Nanoarchaeota archaeon]|nr:YggS family pyridoxal phosphate-dependent enzyme [Nanoarchaeota archaeon]
MADIKTLETNLCKVLRMIDGKAELIAVTKSVDAEIIKQLASLGQKVFGENHVQDAEQKILVLNEIYDGLRWHMIGHLQSNKVKKAVRLFDVIQSVDSLKLVSLIDKEAGKINKRIDILIQINISKENQKSGIEPSAIHMFFAKLKQMELRNIKVIGIMGMAPFCGHELVRPYFRKMKEIFDSLRSRYNISILSMGMSNDYIKAVEEGSNMVRVGTVLFR